MSRNRTYPLLIVVILLISLAGHGSSEASSGISSVSQTIPTRTPTGAPPPTVVIEPPPPGSDPTATPPTVTATTTAGGPTATPSGTFVPADSLTPTAAVCSDRPTAQALNITNIRSGPGEAYPIIDKMFYLQVNLISGRADQAAWWQIALDSGGTGWVADAVVEVQGYTGQVAVVAAPPIGGETVTPGAPWNPTPWPSCTVVPTYTPTSTPEAPATETETATAHSSTPTTTASETPVDVEITSSEVSGTSTPKSEPADAAEETPEAEASPTVGATSATSTPSATAAFPAVESSDESPPDPEPILVEEPSRTVDLLPVAGIGLLVAGIGLSFARRRRQRIS